MSSDPIELYLPETTNELEAIQAERRKAAFEKAKSAPYFKDKLNHINTDFLLESEEWAKIPILDKEQLRAMDTETFYNDFCIAPRKSISEFWRSGGSTGRPLFYPRTSQDMHFGLIGFMRVLVLAGLTDSDIAHMSLPLGVHPAGHLMSRAGSKIGAGMVWAGGGNTLPSGAQLDLIRMFQPSVWIGMASYGIQLANLARSEGFDLSKSGVSKILCTAEPLSQSKRQKLSSLWNATVKDSYGMTEVMMLGGEDEACDGFRFWSDFCYPEVLDSRTLEPVAEGEPGLLIVTALKTNNATPFIRWNTGDIVSMHQPVTGATGFEIFPLIKHTHRTEGFVKVRGVNIGFTDLEDLMFAIPLISDFRVEILWQDDRDELDLHVELPAEVKEQDASKTVISAVERTFGLKPRIVIAPPGSIAKNFEGSFKPVRVQDLRK